MQSEPSLRPVPKATRPRQGSSGRLSADPPLIVLKVGTSTLMTSDADTGVQRLQIQNIASIVEVIRGLRDDGYWVILVSSGAVGMGCIKLGIPKPTSLRTKQAVAAAGQSRLMGLYENLFSTVQLQIAQILLAQSDFMDLHHWSNVKHTILEALKLGLVPIVNENDSTNLEELRFGDNDNLAALTAVQMEAHWLFLFTDVDYLYTGNPRDDPDAVPVRIVSDIVGLKVNTESAGTKMGTGGMATKVVAARTAAAAGISCGLLNGSFPQRITSFLSFKAPEGSAEPGTCNAEVGSAEGMPHGTLFKAMEVNQSVSETRRWILSLPIAGELVIDDGAAKAIALKKSLFPAGVKEVSGSFARMEAIRIVHRSVDIARGIINFSMEQMKALLGKPSSQFEDILGYSVTPEACYRSNIILLVASDSLTSLPENTAPAT